MKNREFYKDKIMNKKYKAVGENSFCNDFVKPYVLKTGECGEVQCTQCCLIQSVWLEEEYKEPDVDWSKVSVDTPVLVSSDGEKWEKGYFAAYDDGIVCTYPMGATSWSSKGGYTLWKYAKLAEVNE